jgi:endonuclease YncB( thermonuclease family)
MTARQLGAGLLLALAAAQALGFGGVVTHVTDGDTVWIDPDDAQRGRLKLRLAGLDAPERCQAWGPEAGSALRAKVLNRRVEVETRAVDAHGRAIGTMSLEGEDVGAWLVVQGHAWSARWQRSRGPYADHERDARAARRGLFADAGAVSPREFRRRHGSCE